jgi:prepilin-type N-terminal cleavage/methylation domain-containing protein
MDRRQSPNRAGFTLIEVLVAILIIALLVAILLPAVRAAYRKAQDAQVGAEINNLATSLASFKNTYGDYPPSRVILCEGGYTNYLNNAGAAVLNGPAGPLSPSGVDTDITVSQLVQRSRLYMRRFWSRVDFDNGSIAFDFNNNGVPGEVLILTGSECLTFFLGGIPLNNINGTTITSNSSPGFAVTGVSGFSRLPTNPFQATVFANPRTTQTISTNRTVPNYEFNNARLVDLDGDGIPSYLDPMDITPHNGRAYAYFCSYGTNSYDPNDDNGNGRLSSFEQEDDLQTYVERQFTVGFPTTGGTTHPTVISPAPNPYCSGTPIATSSLTWINPNSFQLFAAGQDRFWGLGGQYSQNSLGSLGNLPIQPSPQDPGNLNNDYYGLVNGVAGTSVRLRENDNLTNFAGGRLD